MNQRKAGVILSYISMGANSIIMLVYIPMLLHYLTKNQYGIYQLMGSLIAYLSIMDFGLSNSTTRYLSQALAQQDETQISQVINTSYTLYSLIAGLLVLLGIVFYCCITPIYGASLSSTDLLTAKMVFLILLFNMFFTVPSNIFVSVINAYERFVFLRGVNLIKVLLQPLVVWGVLSWKASVFNLVLAQTGFNLFVVFLNYMYCKTKFHVSFVWQFHNKGLMRELTGFSLFVFLHALMDLVYWRLGQLVLGAVSGAAAVATYAIAIQLTTFAIFLPATMGGVFLPKLSAITTKTTDLTEINEIFCKMGRLQFAFIVLLLVGFAFLGKTFIYLWVGPGYEACYWIALILMTAYVLDVSQNVGIPILQAMKKHAFRAYVYVAMAVLNTLLCIPFAKYYGEIGCAVATAICLLLGSGVLINWYYARIGLDLKVFFCNLRHVCKGILLAVLCISVYWWQFPLQHDWLSLFMHGIIITGIYGVCIWFFSFNEYEKNLVKVPLGKMYYWALSVK